MHTTQNLFDKLLKLNQEEQVAQIYFQSSGHDLSYSQYFYLLKRDFTPKSLELLHTASAATEIKNFEQQFRQTYQESGLSEQDFLPNGKNIAADKLLRFVHIPAHKHSFLEIACVLSGNCTHIINGNSYEQTTGSITYIPSNIFHELHASPDCLCITIKIRRDTFLNFQLPNMPYFSVPVSFYCGNDPFIQNIVLSIYEQQEQNLMYNESIIEHLFQILLTYSMQNFQDTMTLLVTGGVQSKLKLDIINYMFENYQNATLHAMAKHFHYSEAYLSNLIHQDTGETFSQILRNFRLGRAVTLLEETNLKLNDICDAIGYKDTTQFIRSFKERYGVTPAKYRKQKTPNL